MPLGVQTLMRVVDPMWYAVTFSVVHVPINYFGPSALPTPGAHDSSSRLYKVCTLPQIWDIYYR